MQSAILAKNASNQVCAKLSYSGDLSIVDVWLDAYRLAYPTYSFTKFADDQDSEFVNAVIESSEELSATIVWPIPVEE